MLYLFLAFTVDIRAEDVVCAQNGFHTWTMALKEFVEGEFGVQAHLRVPGPISTYRSVQFSILTNGVNLEVDLLVSPYWDSPNELYIFLSRIPEEKRSMYASYIYFNTYVTIAVIL